jgi:hypothetical protein
MSIVVRIPTSQITDWDSFHSVFSEALGFPDFYGRNMDAWIDCLTYIDQDDGMRRATVSPGESLILELEDEGSFRDRCPDQYAKLVECAEIVNRRHIEKGKTAELALSRCE